MPHFPRKDRLIQHAYDPCSTAGAGTSKHVCKLKDRRRIATDYDCYANIFLAAITLSATVILWSK